MRDILDAERGIGQLIEILNRPAKLAGLPAGDRADIHKRAEIVETLRTVQTQTAQLRGKLPSTACRKISGRPTQAAEQKMLSDTVRVIAYRAEIALVTLLHRHQANENEARALIRELFVSAADIEPDQIAKTLTVRIHRMGAPVHDQAVRALLDQINKFDFHRPETEAEMVYALL